MCCRFYTDDETKKDILEMVGEYDRSIDWMREGDVSPSDKATVIIGKDADLYATDMRWGFLSPKEGELLFNARSDTARKKKSFSDSVENGRLVIPAKGFYEWDRDKHKATVTAPDGNTLYIAGLYREDNGEKRFTVLTTDANESMKKIHDRMPLLLSKEEVPAWIGDPEKTDEFLRCTPDDVEVYQEFSQMSLFD